MQNKKWLFVGLLFAVLFAFGRISNVKAAVDFADVGPGATDDEGETVTDPTVFTLDSPVTTRYLRVEAKNDGSLEGDEEGEGEGSYIEIRNIKAWAGGSANVLNGIYSGGDAHVVEIDGYDGAEPYHDDLETDCSGSWYPQGTLCDEIPTADSKTASSKSNSDSGATWSIESAESTGVLVIDLGSVQTLTEIRVFQMFSDGKTTQIRFAYHAETGEIAPSWDGEGWTTFANAEDQDDDLNDDQEEDQDDTLDDNQNDDQTIFQKANILSWKAEIYEKPSTSCQQRLKLTIKGKHFDKKAEVLIGEKKAFSINRKSSSEIVAKFCLKKLFNVKTGLRRTIWVNNPDAEEEKADKKINISKLTFQTTLLNFDSTTIEGIKNIQTALIRLGYLDAQYLTGNYGSITTAAVKKFQADNGLPQTGYVGPLTKAKLGEK